MVAPRALRERATLTIHSALPLLVHMLQGIRLGTLLGDHHGGARPPRWQSERRSGQTSASSGGAVLSWLPCRSLARTLGAWPMARKSTAAAS